MNKIKNICFSIFSIVFLAFILFSATAARAAEEPVNGDQSEQNLVAAAQAMRASGRVQFNFKDLDMILFVRFMSELLGENIVVNPGIKGMVSVVSPRAIDIKEARQVMLTILELNGLSMQSMGGFSKVVPANMGPSSTNNVVKGPQSVAPGEELLVQIVPLEYVKAAFVVEPVKIGVPGINIIPLASGSSVLITGKAVLLNRTASIIRALDAPDSIRSVKVAQLNHASANLVAAHLTAVAQDVSSKLAFLMAIGDERSGKVTLIGGRESLIEAEKIILELDVESTVDTFHVYKLQNADAKTVAEQLGQIMAVAAKLQPDPNQQKPTSVVADVSTNSLILTAPREQYAAIHRVIEDLDVQPKQVLLRGLIAEVNLNKLNSAGIDWSMWGGDIANDLLIGGNAQLGSSGVPSQFMEWFSQMTTDEQVHYDANGNAVTTKSTKGMGLVYAYISMLNTFNAVNILSMPRLMCTDNLPSALQVGQVIPIMKGQTSDISNPAATQSSYEYKDTGLILKVTPHIRSGNLVALDIEQTIEELVTAVGNTTPTTSKRLIQTNVLVGNNETIILGGLIREVEKTLKNRVPGISYIPLLGNLFTSQSRTREKVDLMVFLTPTIIETPQDATQVTIDVSTGTSGLSRGERETILRNYDEFQRSNKKEGIPKEDMTLTNVSGDVTPKDEATVEAKPQKESGMKDRRKNRDEK